MIKTNELRIGNWVNESVLGDFKVIEIRKSEIVIEVDSFIVNKITTLDEWVMVESEINPIPITEKWLLKVGAKMVSVSDDTRIGWKIGNYLLLQWEIDKMKHVHFLQNWYYFKTFGEELIIKNK